MLTLMQQLARMQPSNLPLFVNIASNLTLLFHLSWFVLHPW